MSSSFPIISNDVDLDDDTHFLSQPFYPSPPEPLVDFLRPLSPSSSLAPSPPLPSSPPSPSHQMCTLTIEPPSPISDVTVLALMQDDDDVDDGPGDDDDDDDDDDDGSSKTRGAMQRSYSSQSLEQRPTTRADQQLGRPSSALHPRSLLPLPTHLGQNREESVRGDGDPDHPSGYLGGHTLMRRACSTGDLRACNNTRVMASWSHAKGSSSRSRSSSSPLASHVTETTSTAPTTNNSNLPPAARYSQEREGDHQLAAAPTVVVDGGGGRGLKVGKYSVEERMERIHRYRSKRNHRNFNKTIKYECRKTLADSRPRVRGRFAKNDEIELLSDLPSADVAASTTSSSHRNAKPPPLGGRRSGGDLLGRWIPERGEADTDD